MRNRAKCALCGDVLESLAFADIVTCKCENITIWGGGQEFRSNAKDYEKFLRVDDDDNEVAVRFVSSSDAKEAPQGDDSNKSKDKPKDEGYQDPLDIAIAMLESSLNAFENLPDHAKYQNVNQFDHNKLMIIVLGAVKALNSALENQVAYQREIAARIEALEAGRYEGAD